MKKTLKILTAVSLAAVLFGCREKSSDPDETPVPGDETAEIKDYPIIHEKEFGGVYIEISIDDFNKLGFRYGDSVDVTFTNGYTLEDIPYYNGYYVDAGQPLLIAYPGYDYIKAAVNYGDDLWETANLKQGFGMSNTQSEAKGLWKSADLEEHDKASVTLRERGKYLDIQEARDIQYSDDRTKYDSDIIFANFRPMNLGRLKENYFYRSASPCDNQHKRAPYVDTLMEASGIQAILNLSDNDTKIESYLARDDFASPYFKSLYEDGKVFAIALNMNYLSEEFAQKIAGGFAQLSKTEGPYLVHCTEGKDRTGFVCMLLEMLAGAHYQEIADDYMVTYANYYKITEISEPAKYKTILEKNLVAMMSYVTGEPAENLNSIDLQEAARKFLLDNGMSQEDLDAFLKCILK